MIDMKTYLRTSQAGIFFDPDKGWSFPESSVLGRRMRQEEAAGLAVINDWPVKTDADKRREAYNVAGLGFDAWSESIIEFLGTLPNKPPKFAAMWAKREQIRERYPKEDKEKLS